MTPGHFTYETFCPFDLVAQPPSSARVALAFLGGMSAYGQTRRAQQGPPIIRSIDVQYVGPKTISKERVLAQIRTKVGPALFRVAGRTGHPHSLQHGRRSKMFGFLPKPTGDGVKVVVVVQTRSLVKEIEIDGAQRFKAKKLRKEIKIKINGPADRRRAGESAPENHRYVSGAWVTTTSTSSSRSTTDESRGHVPRGFHHQRRRKGAISAVRFEGNTDSATGCCASR